MCVSDCISVPSFFLCRIRLRLMLFFTIAFIVAIVIDFYSQFSTNFFFKGIYD